MEKYLNDLINQKQNIVNILTSYGVSATTYEGLNTLIPKLRSCVEYANAIQKTAKGNPIAIGDVSSVEHSLDVKVRSKNLFDVSKIPSNSKGTIINNGDGTIYVKGSAISTNRTLAQYCPLLRVGDVATISLRVTNALEDTTKNAYIYLYEIKKTWTTNQVFTITQEMLDSKVFLYCRVYGTDIESTPDGIVSQIQVELGSISTAYTPYRTEFEGVEVSRYGKNLLPYPYGKDEQTINGIKFTVNEDGTITANGTATTTGGFSINKIVNLPAGKYSFSGCPKNGGNNKYLINYLVAKDGVIIKDTWETGNGATFDAPNGIDRLFATCRIYQGMTVENLVFKPQYEFSNIPTDYEPYKETQTAIANTDGTVEGLTSLSPNMTLISNMNDIIIDCTYNADTKTYIDNKVLALQTAMVGG